MNTDREAFSKENTQKEGGVVEEDKALKDKVRTLLNKGLVEKAEADYLERLIEDRIPINYDAKAESASKKEEKINKLHSALAAKKESYDLAERSIYLSQRASTIASTISVEKDELDQHKKRSEDAAKEALTHAKLANKDIAEEKFREEEKILKDIAALSIHEVTTSQKFAAQNLFYSYCVESAGIGDIFQLLFKAIMEGNEILKLDLTDPEHIDLRNRLDFLREIWYDYPSFAKWTTKANLRYNAYHRMFNYVINGKENAFVKSNKFNKEFELTFDNIMKNIREGIIDKTPDKRRSDLKALTTYFDSMKIQLDEHKKNSVPDIARESLWLFRELESLLNNATFQKILNIDARDKVQCLKKIAEKDTIAVALSPSSGLLFEIATKMTEFLEFIEGEDWTLEQSREKAELLYYQYRFFKDLWQLWAAATGKQDYSIGINGD